MKAVYHVCYFLLCSGDLFDQLSICVNIFVNGNGSRLLWKFMCVGGGGGGGDDEGGIQVTFLWIIFYHVKLWLMRQAIK